MTTSISAALFAMLAVAGMPLFQGSDTLELRLTGPIDAVVDEKASRESRDFVLDHDGQSYPVEIRARGKSRLRVCAFPPLRLKFPDSDGLFADAGKLKLVTHCRNNTTSEKDVIEEYAVYRMFNALTDASLQVRLARTTYADSGGGQTTRYAFFLEPEKHLAARLDAERAGLNALPINRLDQDHAALVYVFAYLVGNTDWSFVTADNETVCCHNEIVVRHDAFGLLVVPYDFDLVGFVDAKHAKPDARLRMSSVRQRRYRGYCTDKQSLRAAIDHIVRHKDDLMGIVDTLPLLTAKEKASKKRYLEGFFRKATKPERLVNSFDRRCLPASRS